MTPQLIEHEGRVLAYQSVDMSLRLVPTEYEWTSASLKEIADLVKHRIAPKCTGFDGTVGTYNLER